VELAAGTSAAARAAAQDARIDRFREETRDDRVGSLAEGSAIPAQGRMGARCGDQMKLFTTASVPVMTRLRMPERSILDTLVAAASPAAAATPWPGASGWSDAPEGLDQGLKEALVKVDEARGKGPLN